MCAREARGDGCECIRRVRRWDARTRGGGVRGIGRPRAGEGFGCACVRADRDCALNPPIRMDFRRCRNVVYISLARR